MKEEKLIHKEDGRFERYQVVALKEEKANQIAKFVKPEDTFKVSSKPKP